MKKTVKLDRVDWGQVLDGLICRAVLYEETAGYYEQGVSYGYIADVHDGKEARMIAEFYRRIVREIESQLGQGGYEPSIEDIKRTRF